MPFPLPTTADLSSRTVLRMTGADRVRYLNGQVTNDVAALTPSGAPAYACVCTAKGKLEADVFITATEDAFLIDADPALREDLHARLEKYIIADDVELEDVTGERRLFHLFGNPADTVDLPGAVFRPINRFGVPGHDLWTTADSPPPFTAAACASAADLEILRISHGIPKWGAELTPDILPPEAGLQDRAINYTKGCYIGQEVISRIKSVGRVNKQLVSLEGGAPDPGFQPGLTLYTDNPEKPLAIGVLTSCAIHPGLNKWIALGYAKRDHNAPGTRVFAGNDANPRAYPLEIGKTPLI